MINKGRIMKKRGQADQAIKYIIIAVIIAVITFFGFKSFTTLKDRMCKAEIASFQIDLKNLDKEVKYGNVKEFTKQVPCGADKIYFFDLDKVNVNFLNDLPLVKDSIESSVKKNVFLIKNNNIMDSFYAGNLDIEDPNYICFLPKFGRISFKLEGLGVSARVYIKDLQPVCNR